MSLIDALLGGLLIGSGVALLLLRNGSVAGISGITADVASGEFGASGWKLAFLAGLLIPAAVAGLDRSVVGADLPLLALSGGLVGFGTRIGSGCTSGHGVCGIANLSPRSFAATLTFMATAMVTVAVVRHGFAP
jgi:uncharacterized membrane protein YedE/YeeE